MIDVSKLIEAGRMLNAVLPVEGGEPVAMVPTGFSLTGLAQFLPPQFIRQTALLHHAESFVDYVNRFKGAGTVIFANVSDTGATFNAALDYHEGPNKPTRVLHSAKFACLPTAEWTTWMKTDKKEMSQETFAVFLEEHQRLFVAPTGAELLELITTLEGKNHVNFTSGIRLQNGSSRLTFEEDADLRGGIGSGQIEIPQRFSLALSPFEGEAPYSVSARLRYKIASRKLVFWYETITPHLIVRDAARIIVDRVKDGTKVQVMMGAI
jgi:uncharacterized protein YfdQ (DUF2303 family)